MHAVLDSFHLTLHAVAVECFPTLCSAWKMHTVECISHNLTLDSRNHSYIKPSNCVALSFSERDPTIQSLNTNCRKQKQVFQMEIAVKFLK